MTVSSIARHTRSKADKTLRYTFSSDPAAGIGNMGWDVPLLTSRVKMMPDFGAFEVKLICGKKLYFRFPAMGGGNPATFWLLNATTYSQDGQWRADVTGLPMNSFSVANSGATTYTFTITRWDGWKLHFTNGGPLLTLTTDTGVVIRWNRTGTGPVTSITIPATGQTLLTAAYSGGNHTAITVNGDLYQPVTNYNGQLEQVGRPDGTTDAFTYTNFSSANFASHSNPSNPGAGNASMEHTSRYGTKLKLTWEPNLHFIKSDGVWNYTILAPPLFTSTNGRYGTPDVKRTRIATGEWEQISFSGDRDGTRVIRGIDGSETRVTEIKGDGPTFGKTSKVERKIGPAWVQTYLAAYDQTTGRVIRKTDAKNKDTVYTYTNHPGTNLPHPIASWSASTNYAPPKTKLVTDATGRQWTYEYDVRGNLLSASDMAGVTRAYTYDSRDRRITVKNTGGGVVAQYTYNNNNRVTSFSDGSGTTNFGYLDRYGRSYLTQVTSPSGLTASFSYDGRGNRTSATGANGETWAFTTDSDNLLEKITDPLSRNTSFDYDARANLTSVTNALGDTATMEYDDLDLAKKVTNVLSQTSNYTNAANGRLKQLSDNRSKNYQMEYSPLGGRKKLIFPDNSAIVADYDPVGRIIKKTFRDGSYVNIDYDDAGRLTSTSPSGGSSQSIGYDSAGRMSSVSNPVTSTENYSYDSEGRVSGISYGSDGNAGLTYYSDGRLKELTYPSGMVVKYEYDTEGRVDKIFKDGVILVDYTYDTAGRLSAKAFGATGAIGESFTYGALNRLATFSILRGTSVWSAAYTYDALYRRASSVYGHLGGKGDVYKYDAAGQLVGVKYEANNAASGYNLASNPAGGDTYTYDAAGNRSTWTQINGWTVGYTANDLNQYSAIINDAPLVYDGRGNISGCGARSFEYDAFGRLAVYKYNGATVCTYKYDALGRRVQKYNSSADYENHYSLGESLLWIKKQSGSATTNITFIYQPGVDRPVAQVETAGSSTQVYYVHRDVLNSVVALTNDSGLVQTYRYDVWGGYSTQVNTGAAISRFLFTGRESDSETGMYYYRSRNYWPQYARFLQLDPVDFGGDDLNLYRYVGNNPINFTDPSGLVWHEPSEYDQTQGNWDNDGEFNATDDDDHNDADGDGFDADDCEGPTDQGSGDLPDSPGGGNPGEGGGEGGDGYGLVDGVVDVGLGLASLAAIASDIATFPSGEGVVAVGAIMAGRQAAKAAAKAFFNKVSQGFKRTVARDVRQGGTRKIKGVQAGKATYRPKGDGKYSVTPQSGKGKDTEHFPK